MDSCKTKTCNNRNQPDFPCVQSVFACTEKIQGTADKAGGQKIKTVNRYHKKAYSKSGMKGECFCVNSGMNFGQSVCVYKGKNQKRKIVYKHDLPVSLEHTAGCEIKKSSGKTIKPVQGFMKKPPVKKAGAGSHFCYRIKLNYSFHRNRRKKITDQNVRAQKSVVGKCIKICPASKRNPVRKQISCCIKLSAHSIHKRYMLAVPVCF